MARVVGAAGGMWVKGLFARGVACSRTQPFMCLPRPLPLGLTSPANPSSSAHPAISIGCCAHFSGAGTT